MKEFDLNIYSSNRIYYQGKAVSLIVPTVDGNIGIMANHENMVIGIQTGELHYKTEENGPWITAAISRGFAEIIDNHVSILVESIESPDEIDILRAEESRKRAEEKLRQKNSLQEYHTSQASLARALTRLKVSRNRDWKI